MPFKYIKKTILIAIIVAVLSSLSACSVISSVTTLTSIDKDRRSIGVILDDNKNTFTLSTWAFADEDLQKSYVSFLIFDKTLLITGEVENIQLFRYVEEQVKARVTQINKTFNKLKITPASNLLDRGKDAWITGQITALFNSQEVFHPVHVNVTTSDKIVYLMGDVTKREAKKATKIAESIKSVKKVVSLFNYLEELPQKEIEHHKKMQEIEDKKTEKARKKIMLEQSSEIQEQTNDSY